MRYVPSKRTRQQESVLAGKARSHSFQAKIFLGLRSCLLDVDVTMPSATVEDYIKHIYLVSEKRTSRDVADVADVAMGQVAEALGVVPGTATTMVKALSDAGLVEYAPRVGVQLTEPGR